MSTDIGLSDAVFGLGAGIFFVWATRPARFPSNLLLQRFGARIWISRILVVWGIDFGLLHVRHHAGAVSHAALPARHRGGRLLSGASCCI